MRILKLSLGALAIASMSLLGSSCGGGGGGADECGVEAQKQFVLDTTYDWYLFQDLLPARSSINPANYATAQDLLDALTAQANAQHFDRGFSFLTTQQAEEQFFDEGQAVAFGLGTEVRGSDDDIHLFVTRVELGDPAHSIPPSPAANAGFDRGDEILAIGPDAGHLVDVQTLSDDGVLGAAFGPAQVGIQRAFQVQPVGGGPTVVRTMTKALITLDPVPLVETISDTRPVGYVSLNSFIGPAQQQLRDAFAQFRAQGIHDIIVDLRYNGGGLVSVAQQLASLLAQQQAGQTMFSYEFNAAHSDENEIIDFTSQPQSIDADRIAFITTDATASASELTINALDPYADVAIIGDKTFGKPVGQSGFDMPGCDTTLRLITFRTLNASGHANYFNGLPDSEFEGDFCQVDDDLEHERGDVAEASTGTALDWLITGSCPATSKAFSKAQFLRNAHPSLLEDNQPGSF